MELFRDAQEEGHPVPLPVRVRPRTPDAFVGQEHFFAKGKLLRRMLEADRLTSLIFYGPPGTGKTTLAEVIANTTHAAFEHVNAAMSSVKELREILETARLRAKRDRKRTVLFIDEIHRFNRAQQDVLLNDVETGTVLLIGATTQNPFFAINSPLLSRSSIFEFKPLTEEHIRTILARAIADGERGFGKLKLEVTPEAVEHLARTSDGDARRALVALEVGVCSTPARDDGRIVYDLVVAEESIQRKAIVYDGTGDGHYDAASAFIKSMRGGDPDAAVYWMAKMLEAGEDPRFLARRMVILASEDIGNANPLALVVAQSAFAAGEFVGMPEARIILAQAATYLACSPKSNASYLAIEKALEDVREKRTLEVPDSLKDASYPGAKKLARGEGYKYAHDYEGHWVAQDYLGAPRIYYEPTTEGAEAKIRERLLEWRKKKRGKGPEKPSKR
ncbi:MAG: replication-associated recombination protein A [Planctomycetota bacterium]